MVEFKNLKIEGYEQGIKIQRDGSIKDAYCTCMHGSIHRNNWEEGEKICRHLKQAIRILKRRVKGKS